MRSICLALLLIGCSHAAMQQIRSPVYSSQKPGTTTKQPEPIPPVTTTTQQAQAREGTVPVSVAETASVPTGPNAQNYLVYYYPTEQFRAGTNVPTTAVQPYSSELPFFQRIPWMDVGYVALSLGFLVAGGAVLYTGVGSQAKARAMRELQDLDIGQVSDATRRVLRAIEKFQNMNVENQ